MKPVLLAAGVPKHQLHMRSGRHKIETCVKAFDWLHNIYLSEEYAKMVYAWGLLPPEIWDRYILLDVIETREQEILEQAKRRLLVIWKRNRPRLFGKDRPKDISIIDNAAFDSCRP